jgi:predicted GNAT family acetyltransferase
LNVPAEDIEVRDNPAKNRYEVRLGGELVGISAYVVAADRIIFTHTEVDDDVGGRGIGSRLARDALDDVRSRGLRVTARCPFIAAFIRRNRDYEDLLDRPPQKE